MKPPLKDWPEPATYPVYLPQWLYDRALAHNKEWTEAHFRPTQPIPVAPSARKSVRTEYPACMAAHGGKCAICGTGDCERRP